MSSTKICKLSEVITIQNGYAFASKKFTAEEGMPLIRIRDLKNGRHRFFEKQTFFHPRVARPLNTRWSVVAASFSKPHSV